MAPDGQPIGEVRQEADRTLQWIDKRLKEMGLLVADGQARLVRLVPTLLVLGVAVFGIIKIGVGLSRGKPVAFLVVLCVATVLIALIGFARGVHRTVRGDRVLTRLKQENAALEHTARRKPSELAGDDLALAMGLFGIGILAYGPLAPLGTALRPPAGTGGCGAGGGCGGGCGGGGGGGGGCGGGGCGGCGGGGG
jgi:uncharacterized protein (TIGR04222 family)